jgi:hypothetical protein
LSKRRERASYDWGRHEWDGHGRTDVVVRNPDWIDREYGREKWPAILAQIDAQLSSGETDLARVVNRVKRLESAISDDRLQSFVVAGRSLQLPRSFALHGGIGLILEKLIALAGDAEAVIELGSGWGYHLLQLWLNGGPRRARYFALEYTAAGRECTRRLAGIEPNLDLTVVPFDYYDVNLDPLGRFAGRVVVFSCFSIDQIPQLPPAIYPALRKLGARVDGIHFEPAGWQMEGDNCIGSSRAYADKHDYNRNLWPLLKQFEAQGLLRIEASFPNLFGQNPDNSAAMIRWSMGA